MELSIYRDVLQAEFNMRGVPVMSRKPQIQKTLSGPGITMTGFELVEHIRRLDDAIDELRRIRADLVLKLDGRSYNGEPEQ